MCRSAEGGETVGQLMEHWFVKDCAPWRQLHSRLSGASLVNVLISTITFRVQLRIYVEENVAALV
jgi:hypothetical protein